jgi:hypothetical protein
MSGNISGTLVICIILGLISWYYFNKFQESEKEYSNLHRRFEHVYIENHKMKSRINDLQNYKNDVSKTFKILDKELEMINDHLQKESPRALPSLRPPLSSLPSLSSSFIRQNVSLLTPDILTTLLTNTQRPQVPHQQQQQQHQQQQQQDALQPQMYQEVQEVRQPIQEALQPQMYQQQQEAQEVLQPIQEAVYHETYNNETYNNETYNNEDYHHEESYNNQEYYDYNEEDEDETEQNDNNEYKLYLSGNRNYDKYLL